MAPFHAHQVRESTRSDMFTNLIHAHGQAQCLRVLLDQSVHRIDTLKSLLDRLPLFFLLNGPLGPWVPFLLFRRLSPRVAKS